VDWRGLANFEQEIAEITEEELLTSIPTFYEGLPQLSAAFRSLLEL
jgi:hypothetical protein